MLALASLSAGCSGGEDAPSVASFLGPRAVDDANLAVDLGSRSLDASALPDDGIVRTRDRSLAVRYDIRHALRKDEVYGSVAKSWAVESVLRDEATGKVLARRIHQGAQGRVPVVFDRPERLATLTLSPLRAVDGRSEAIGRPVVMRFLFDDAPPRLSLSFGTVRDSATSQVLLGGTLSAADGDPRTPECRPLAILEVNGKQDGTLTLGRWTRTSSREFPWQASFSVKRTWSEPDVASLRAVCSDGTGNLAEVVSNGSAQEEDLSLAPKLVVGNATSGAAVPRLGARDKPRRFVVAGEKIELRTDVRTPQGASVSGVARTLAYAGHSARASVILPDGGERVLLASALQDSLVFSFPPGVFGDASLRVTVTRTGASEEVVANLVEDVFVSSDGATRLSLFEPSQPWVAERGKVFLFQASAVLDGRPFAEGEFPRLESTSDGRTWQAATGAEFTVVEASRDGEAWSVSFPYPHASEKPLRFRLAATLAGASLTSPEVRNPFVARDPRPNVSTVERTACGKARLRPILVREHACVLQPASSPEGGVLRIDVAMQNHGSVPFSLPVGSPGLGYEIRKKVDGVATRVAHGRLVTDATGLNGQGLDAPAVRGIEIPAWALITSANEAVELVIDREPEGGHSLAVGSTCDDPSLFQSLVLSQGGSGISESPFSCE
jgi:hypothetical protein